MLRAVRDDDLEVFYVQQADPEAVAMGAVPARHREDHFKRWAGIEADPTVVTRTIVSEDGGVAGNIVIFGRDRHRWVGYWLGRDFWGRGLASAALAELLAEVPDDRPLRATVVVTNVASRRVLEKSGFVVVAERVGDDGLDEIVLELSA